MTTFKRLTAGIILLLVLIGLATDSLPEAKGADGEDYFIYLPIVSKAPPVLTIEPIVRAPGSNEWTVSWTGGNDTVAQYVLEEADDAAFTAPAVYTATETFVDFDYGASINQVFYYRVRAEGNGVEGPWSKTVRVVGVYYYDDFSNANSGWTIGNSATSSYGYQDGQYKIGVSQAGILSVAGAPNTVCDGYEAEVTANWASGSATNGIYGLMFGANNSLNNYYFLAVRSDTQAYRLFLYNGGNLTNLTNWIPSGVINSGAGINKLHVARAGSRIDVSINDSFLGSYSDGTLTGATRMGVLATPSTANPTAEARFDDFTVGACGLLGTQATTLTGSVLPSSSETAVDVNDLD